MSVAVSLWITVALVALSAFFVAIEFALVAARRYRLEEAAETSAAARAALASAKDLSLLLAGSQLGITLCVLGLGAVSKPAVESLLSPLFGGLNEGVAGVLSFVLSLIVVTFLHLVVGEMAPKSWAIAHPERSATMLALPMRGFMILTRPVLLALNGVANWFLRRVGVEPVDELGEGRNPDDLRELVDHSASTGALDAEQRDQILSALDVDRAPLRDIVRPRAEVSWVPADADVRAIREAARASGHLRLVVGRDGEPVGVVHVRDALAGPAGTTAADLMRPVATLSADTAIHDALRAMREKRNHLALVESDGELLGLVTMQDLLDRLLPV
ncbi:hemolysin family protein [Pseudonocardia abyssalis]|uniref:HlyC/CorC family transporter n=1 Tax=Pseudonocardia abyssalis TaxID=2792008 RepID=A0ABS6UTE0_9PSEU|nr:hemolysin family protein [Pseudonocardia abyssalis]MBW0116093.1 HlyC/CorC family transporter [Pseudonocardia abyssalis]MBW0135480.1 HlyC/CorC family transporter [Pseudonocardia abyssalis]